MGNLENRNQRESRFRAIASKVQQLIAQRSILPGDRLPAERRLADELQVSRTSVREALRILEQKDLVEIRLGKNGGAYVKPPSHRQLSEGMEILLRFNQLSLDQIAEFREAIECTMVDIAARNAGPDDIRLLKSHLESTRCIMGKGQGGIDEFIEADKALHRCIAQIVGNPLFVQGLDAAFGIKRYFCRFHRLNPSFMETNFNDLHEIVRAIENRQPDVASLKAKDHIAIFNKSIL
jgi:DNA-binding FadR family transcriptional regulator